MESGAGNLDNKKKRGVKRRTFRLVMIALFVALITVGAFVKFPLGIGAVPISLQCAFCIATAHMLGAVDSTVAVFIYLFLGIVGVPIFTAGGGFSYVFQPTFGYLLGYLFALPACGLIARGVKNEFEPKFWRLLLGAAVAIVIIYSFGVLYMWLILNLYVGKSISFAKALLTGALVFLPTDLTFASVASVVAYKVLPRVKNVGR